MYQQISVEDISHVTNMGTNSACQDGAGQIVQKKQIPGSEADCSVYTGAVLVYK